ncbi:hypothetical protein TGPRC2_253660 [Toxoplasma gondii TgCatPRC2]|uniref:Uncharacterized protein n=1 Tax=Toxoplasma gondii TgCatPRC2 TaxID=1130821 RepID=A0A151HDL5_TOXGO|nr:hypothetical protein TGPRC2_253660 [Toxoplasma gondii TgCatPRC2]
MKQRDVANRVIAHLRTELDLIRREVVEAKHRDIIGNRVDQQAPASSAGDRSSSFVNSSESSKPLRSRTRGWKQIDEIKERNRELTQEICDLAETVSHLKRVIKDKADAEQRQSEVRSCCRLSEVSKRYCSVCLFLLLNMDIPAETARYCTQDRLPSWQIDRDNRHNL